MARLPWRRSAPAADERRDDLGNPGLPVFDYILGLTDGTDGSVGTHVTPHRAMRVIAFLSCVRLIAETIASLPIQVFERDGVARKASVDPRADLIAWIPNVDMTAFDFWSYVLVSMLVYGNAYVWIEYDADGKPAALWPISPTVIRKYKQGDGTTRWVIDLKAGQPDGWLADNEVMHFKGIGLDSEVGMSNVAQAREAIGIAMAAEQYAGHMFQNDGTPGAIYKQTGPGKGMTDEQFQTFANRIRAGHEGLRNSHRFSLLPPGIEYQASGFDPTNLQMVAAREFQVREMARLFRIPPHMIGDLQSGAAYASIEQMSIDFVTYTLRPWLINIQQVVGRKLFGQPADRAKGMFVEHDTSDLLRADSRARSYIDNVYKLAGIKTSNEIRESIGLPPLPGGDVLWQPVNVQVVNPDGSITTPGVDSGKQPAPVQAANPGAEDGIGMEGGGEEGADSTGADS